MKILPELFANEHFEKVSCVIILLGSNDCFTNAYGPNVPLEDTEKNLTTIITHLKSKGISSKKIILLTPPVYHHQDSSEENGTRTPDEYSVGVKRVADQLEVECVDINKITKEHPNSRSLFYDGLHFNRAGAQVVYDAVWPSLVNRIIDFHGSFELKFPSYEVIEKPESD